jgi:hypothetical protein
MLRHEERRLQGEEAMSRNVTIALAAATSLLLAGAPALNAKPAPAPQKLVIRVRGASVMVIKTPHSVKICARASVPTSGWTNPQLRPVIYVQAPPNGIYDFDFVATPPSGIAAQVITPIQAVRIWTPYPAGLHGVRVKGANGSVVGMLNHEPAVC